MVVNLPTGNGKSLCYTLCPLTTDNFCSVTRKEQRSILILHPSLLALPAFVGVDFAMASRWSQSTSPLLKLPTSFSYATWHVIIMSPVIGFFRAWTNNCPWTLSPGVAWQRERGQNWTTEIRKNSENCPFCLLFTTLGKWKLFNQGCWYYAMVWFCTFGLKSHPIAQFEENQMLHSSKVNNYYNS